MVLPPPPHAAAARVGAAAPTPAPAPAPAPARLDPRRGKTYSCLEKANKGLNFSEMELYALIHELKQQLADQRRGLVRNEDEQPSCE